MYSAGESSQEDNPQHGLREDPEGDLRPQQLRHRAKQEGLQDRDPVSAAEHSHRGVRPGAAGALQDGDCTGAEVR